MKLLPKTQLFRAVEEVKNIKKTIDWPQGPYHILISSGGVNVKSYAVGTKNAAFQRRL